MRVIEQLIGYLLQRGYLSSEQLEYLRTEGYWRPAGENEEAPEAGPFRFDDLYDGDDPVFAIQESLERERTPGKAIRTRKSSGQLRAERARQAGELCAGLAAGMVDWEAPLGGLRQVALRLTGTEVSLEQATVAIRNAEPDALGECLVAGLDARQPALDLLWDGLSFEGYRTPLDDSSLPRAIATAYRAILEAAGRSIPSTRGWLLKEPAIRFVCNLVRAQRSLLASLGTLEIGPRGGIARAIRRQYHPGAYWACVLVYSARSPAANGYTPRRAQPDEAGWSRAWAHALTMDPARVTPFFGAYVARRGADEADSGEPELGLVCPKEWDR